jgi:branched-chain amino acid transport system ATP-binding protein
MLEIRGLSVTFGKVRALTDVDLSVKSGTVHGVIGPNGAGKSTLIDSISGRTRPSAGTIRVAGQDVTRMSIAARRHRGISRSFQRTSIFPSLTVRDQLQLASTLGSDVPFEEIAETLGLTALLDDISGTIAYGDQRRVDIALALIGTPTLLLLDEPGAGLSATETLALFDHVANLVQRRGITAVIVEHDVNAVFATCDTVTVLDLGSVLTTGEPSAVRADERVIKAYLGSAA